IRLAPGVTYHYRLVVKGAGGESYSPDSIFTLYAPAPAQMATDPFTVGQSTPAPFSALPLLSAPVFPLVPAEPTAPTSKPLTKTQKLAKALDACKKLHDGKRKSCERTARSKYGGTSKKRKKM
ncbi:MAG TPA: hypothetical protein VK680_03325, partial [Solirubrobacteraceae bacterium]|nr:hypothetical protein [Solirubrobacteraceae bacterium]